jgi:F0F1-type ATP synthase assembly protein I
MAEKTSKNDEKKPSELKDVANSYRSGWSYAEYAFQYGMAIVVCTLIGYGLDKWLGTGNTLMIIGVVFGSVFGFMGLLKSLGALNFGKGKQKSGKEK